MYSFADGMVEGALRGLQGTYREVIRVRTDAENCISLFSSLHAQTATVYVDGSSRTLLTLQGTIPVEYDRTYNFPVEIIVPEAYPFKAPIFKVTPVGNLRIRPHHRNVDEKTGIVYIPYLTSWNPAICNLAELVLEVSSEFGKDPPLYEASQSMPAPALARHGSSSQRPPPPPPISLNGHGRPPPSYQSQVPPPVYQQSATATRKPPPPPISSVPKPPVKPSITDLKAKVKARLQAKYAAEFGKVQQEIQTQLETSEQLSLNGEELAQRMATLRNLEKEFTIQMERIQNETARVTESIAERQKLGEEIVENLEDYVQPSDAISKQLMQCVAESLAIDDILYHLNAALIRQKIDLKTFMRKARDLSREQFMKQALATKIYHEQTAPELVSPPGEMRAKPAGKGHAFSSPPPQYPQSWSNQAPPRYPQFGVNGN